jgi:hypothetical protein
MSDEPIHRVHGTRLSDWIEAIPHELPLDAVGMWQFVPAGRRGFGLEGEALVAFVRRAIAALLERGAVPVVSGADEGYFWLPQPQYGSSPAEIVENVVREWIARGLPDCDVGGLWFALPEDVGVPFGEDSGPE